MGQNARAAQKTDFWQGHQWGDIIYTREGMDMAKTNKEQQLKKAQGHVCRA